MKTTKLTSLTALAALALSLPAFSAEPEKKSATKVEVKKETTTTTFKEHDGIQDGTVAASIRDGATFSILARAIAAAGLNETLGSKDAAYTVFAPTDEAFAKLPEGTLNRLLLPENKEKLRTLLLFHVIPGQMLSTTFTDGEVKTSSGDKVKIDVDGTKIKVGDAKVVNPDVVATNGVVHVIDHVIVPKSLDDFAGLKKD